MKDLKIIQEIRDGNTRKAVKGLYGYFSVIRKYIVANNGTKEDAEDVFQDALVVLFNKINAGEFQLTSSLDTYLFSVCKNLWFEQLRRLKKQNEIRPQSEISIPENEISVSEAEHKTILALKAIEQLGEKCKELLHLFYNKKLSMAEIAGKLGFSTERVAKNQKYRCIEKAREYYLSNQ